VNSQGTTEIYYNTQPFESSCFNNRTFEIVSWNTDNFPAAFCDLVLKEQLVSGDLVYVRIPANDVERIKQTEAAGFYFVECSVGASLNLSRWNHKQFKTVPTYRAGDDSISSILTIAASTFTELRFNRDPYISNEAANNRYLTWVKNAYRDGQIIRYITAREEIAGFSLLRNLDEKTLVWNQAGLKPEYKNSGLGMILYASILAWCKNEGFEQILGGFSVANLSALNVHAALGFRLTEPTVVLHYYVKSA
jgi:GNAT superfamily N-acetyltransferase